MEAGGVSSLTAGTGENVSSNEENGLTETLLQIPYCHISAAETYGL